MKAPTLKVPKEYLKIIEIARRLENKELRDTTLKIFDDNARMIASQARLLDELAYHESKNNDQILDESKRLKAELESKQKEICRLKGQIANMGKNQLHNLLFAKTESIKRWKVKHGERKLFMDICCEHFPEAFKSVSEKVKDFLFARN